MNPSTHTEFQKKHYQIQTFSYIREKDENTLEECWNEAETCLLPIIQKG
jgi:hypothetical protein